MSGINGNNPNLNTQNVDFTSYVKKNTEDYLKKSEEQDVNSTIDEIYSLLDGKVTKEEIRKKATEGKENPADLKTNLQEYKVSLEDAKNKIQEQATGSVGASEKEYNKAFENMKTLRNGLETNTALGQKFEEMLGTEEMQSILMNSSDNQVFNKNMNSIGQGEQHQAEEKKEDRGTGVGWGVVDDGKESQGDSKGRIKEGNVENKRIDAQKKSKEAKTKEALEAAGIKEDGKDSAQGANNANNAASGGGETYKALNNNELGEKGIVQGDAYSSSVKGTYTAQKTANERMRTNADSAVKNVTEKTVEVKDSKIKDGVQIDDRKDDTHKSFNAKKDISSAHSTTFKSNANQGGAKGAQGAKDSKGQDNANSALNLNAMNQKNAKGIPGSEKDDKFDLNKMDDKKNKKTQGALGLEANQIQGKETKSMSYKSGDPKALDTLKDHRGKFLDESSNQINKMSEKTSGIKDDQGKQKENTQSVKTETLGQDNQRAAQAGTNVDQAKKGVQIEKDMGKNIADMVKIGAKAQAAAQQNAQAAASDVQDKQMGFQIAQMGLQAAQGVLAAAMLLPDVIPLGLIVIPNPAKPPAVMEGMAAVALAQTALGIAQGLLNTATKNQAEKQREQQNAEYQQQMNQLTGEFNKVAQKNQEDMLKKAEQIRTDIFEQVKADENYIQEQEKNEQLADKELAQVQTEDSERANKLNEDLQNLEKHIQYQEKLAEKQGSDKSFEIEGSKQASDAHGSNNQKQGEGQESAKVEGIPEEFQAGKEVSLEFKSDYDPESKTFKKTEDKNKEDKDKQAATAQKTENNKTMDMIENMAKQGQQQQQQQQQQGEQQAQQQAEKK